MKDPNRFYTYAYLREDGTPYYIGKGSGDRINDNTGRGCKKPKDKIRIIFLKQNLTEEEAFRHEIYMIDVFGRKDIGTGILYNRTNGGDGVSGAIISEELKRKKGEKIRGEKHPAYGKRWWNDGCGNNMRSVECPGKGWVLGQSEETKRKNSESKKGRKWWNDGCGNEKFCIECPGEGWILGMSEETAKNKGKILRGKKRTEEIKREIGILTSKKNMGRKWWNDGCGNNKFCKEYPGEGWVLGMSEETKRKQSGAKKSEITNKTWWNDGCGNIRYCVECPGDGWVPGRGKVNKDT
jgi:hypothetical protein